MEGLTSYRIKSGEIITLSPFDREFLHKAIGWMDNAKLRYLTQTPQVDDAIWERWYECMDGNPAYRIFGVSTGGRKIGMCGLRNITEHEGEYYGYIGEVDCWGRGIGRVMVGHIVEYARLLGLESVYLRVAPFNSRARRLYDRMGFSFERGTKNSIVMRRTLRSASPENKQQ